MNRTPINIGLLKYSDVTFEHKQIMVKARACYWDTIIHPFAIAFMPKRIGIDWIKSTRNIKAGIITEVR